MRYCLPGVVIFLGLLILVTCAPHRMEHKSEPELNPGWEVSDTWTVGVKFWPSRLADPKTTADTYIYQEWNYRVSRILPGGGYYIEQFSDSDSYLLLLSSGGDLLEVRCFLERMSGGRKYETARTNQPGSGVFFYVPDFSHPPVIWYHPALSGLHAGETRFNFISRSSDWIRQEVSFVSRGYEITLVHKPSDSEIYFYWEKGDPWWKRAIWRHNKRVVASAELL
ncbi:MAG: hypothetical protein ACLFN5_04675 [bacterium]